MKSYVSWRLENTHLELCVVCDGKMMPWLGIGFGKDLEERFMGQLDIASYHDFGSVRIYVTKRRIFNGAGFQANWELRLKYIVI